MYFSFCQILEATQPVSSPRTHTERMAVFGSVCCYDGDVFIIYWVTVDASQWGLCERLNHKDP